ncbi:MAG: DUF6263 family protein [Gemmataceae bacterium]
MARIRLGVSAALVFALAALVSAQEPKKDPPKDPPKTEAPKVDPKPADPKVDGKRFETKFDFEKKTKLYQETTTKLTQFVKVQGQDLTQTQNSTFYFEWTPVKQEGDKSYVKQKVEGLKMTIDISGNTISYDSTKGDTPTAGNPGLTEFFKKLSGAEFTAVIEKGAKVVEVQGKADFIRGLSTGSPQMESLLNKILTDDALKDMCDPTLKLVPEDGPKKVGDTWSRKGTVNLGPIGSYTITYNFKYVGVEKDMDKIEVEPKLEYTAPKKDDPGAGGLLFRINGGSLGLEAGKPSKGTILYDPKNQRVASADITIHLKGKLTVAIGGTDTEVELSQEQTTSVKTSDSSLVPVKK